MFSAVQKKDTGLEHFTLYTEDTVVKSALWHTQSARNDDR